MAFRSSPFFHHYRYDLILGSIASFYVLTVPYTKVEESFNVQAIHDILYHGNRLVNYDHLEFPGVVPRTFIGAFSVALLSSPFALLLHLLRLPKVYSLVAVRLLLGGIVLWALRLFRSEIRRKFGDQVEAFFVVITSVQFHFLFYCSRTLPNVFSLACVNLAYSFWLRERYYAALNCLVFATLVFRCDLLILLGPLALELLLMKCVSIRGVVKNSSGVVLLSIVLTITVDSVMWGRLVWPEFEVLWFNSFLNRSSEWGTSPFYWYFTSALPRSLLGAYGIVMIGIILERRLLFYVLPVFAFVLLYSKLPHKELRFIMGAIPMFNLSAAVAASRIFNNRKKSTVWRVGSFGLVGLLIISIVCTMVFFMAAYDNYPSGVAIKKLHSKGADRMEEIRVHIDTFSAMNGISRFCENGYPWRYSKEEGISLNDFQRRNFSYLISEHWEIKGYTCLFSVEGFTGARFQLGLPPIQLLTAPKVYVHQSSDV